MLEHMHPLVLVIFHTMFKIFFVPLHMCRSMAVISGWGGARNTKAISGLKWCRPSVCMQWKGAYFGQ